MTRFVVCGETLIDLVQADASQQRLVQLDMAGICRRVDR